MMMNELKLTQMLRKADFSAQTDLKERLRSQLFASNVQRFPSRQMLEEDDLDMIFAAGDGMPGEDDKKPGK